MASAELGSILCKQNMYDEAMTSQTIEMCEKVESTEIHCQYLRYLYLQKYSLDLQINICANEASKEE